MNANYLNALSLLLVIISGCGERTLWEPLFNGEDLSGWEIKAKPEDQGRNFWFVQDGYIEANTLGIPEHDYIWLYSEKEYGDFEIKFKFQAFADNPGNSGIQVRSRYDADTYWLNGPQIDIHPPGYWRTGMMWDETRGNQRWIFPEVPEGEWVDSTMALNEVVMFRDGNRWNEMKVRVEGLHIQAWLNDRLITDYDGAGVLDDAVHTNLKVGTSGHIAFQIHTGDKLKIRYKDIYIRSL